MTTLYVLDVPENTPLAKVAAEDPAVTVGRIGPYFEITSDAAIVIDRRATFQHILSIAQLLGNLGLSAATFDILLRQ